MKEEQIKQKAIDFVRDYLRDNLILDAEALVLFTTEIIKELQKENYIQEQIIIGDQIEHNEEVKKLKKQIEKMKADVKQEQSYWNSGEMQFGLLQRILDKWE